MRVAVLIMREAVLILREAVLILRIAAPIMRVAVLIMRIADDVRLGAFGGNAEHSLAFLKDIVASKGEATRIQEVRLHRPTARSAPFPLRAVPA
jgi:hypothetical protein